MFRGEYIKQSGFSWYRAGLWGAIGIIGYFLFTEHRAHLIYFLPYALLLACPVMHLFMHHGNHESHSARSNENERGHKHVQNQKKEWS